MKRVDRYADIISIARHATAAASSFAIASRVDRLQRVASQLDRLNTIACNEDVPVCDDCDPGRDPGKHVPHTPAHCHYAKTEAAEKRATDIGRELGLVVTTQRDPRGAAVKVWADKEDGRLLAAF